MAESPEQPVSANWARYRRLMRWMVLVTSLVVIAALAWLRWTVGALPIHMVIATIAGVGFSVMLGTALMGLVFLSAGSGHDDRVGTGEDDDA